MRQVELKLSLPGPFDGEPVRDELHRCLEGKVDRIKRVDIETPGDGRRGAGEVFALVVSTVGTVAQVIDLVHGWLAGRRDRKSISVVVSVNADAITIVGQPTAREGREIESFIRRHDRDA